MKKQDYVRPFEFLKLVRDRKITSIDSLLAAAAQHKGHGSMLYHLERELLQWTMQLQELGLIEVNDGVITPTKRLSGFFSSLEVSLSRLANYTSDSVVSSPIFGVPEQPAVRADIFVIMPFLKELRAVYDDHIRPAAQKMNLTVARGDDFFTAKSVMSDIWNAMNASRLVIADCTGRNPNVFYEMGMAHTLGKPVILISQDREDIPFDIQHIRYLIYNFTPRGMPEFEKNLTATIESELKEQFSYEMLLTPPDPTQGDHP